MEAAGGCLGWSESEFWRSSPAYFRASIEGFRNFHGSDEIEAPDEDEMEEAFAQLERKEGQ